MFQYFSSPQDIGDYAKVTIEGETFDIKPDDLERGGLLGTGAYGVVEEMTYKPKKMTMAVKVSQYV